MTSAVSVKLWSFIILSVIALWDETFTIQRDEMPYVGGDED